MSIENYKGVWVFAEQRKGKLLDVGLELLGEGRKIADKLGQELAAVLFGQDVAPLVDELASGGADKVYLADHPLLSVYRVDSYALTMEALVNRYKPGILLIGGTAIGMDLAPRIAAKVNTGLSAHCVALEVDDGGCLKAKVPAFGGSLMASITCAKRPQMATIPPGVMRKPERKAVHHAKVEKVEVRLAENNIRTRVIEIVSEEPKSQPIDLAEYIVAGGFGVGSKENWKMLEELAVTLGGSVGATRPACDEGWATLETQMIGQSGKTVHPKLYIGIGISGEMHHTIGIKDSKVIVAINKDPKAPILEAADYAIVSDFREIVPLLIEELKKLRKQ